MSGILIMLVLCTSGSAGTINAGMGFATGDMIDAIPIEISWNYSKYGEIEGNNGNTYHITVTSGMYFHFLTEEESGT